MRIRSFIFHVLLPITLGGTIYTCWRTQTLWMFCWYHQIGLDSLITYIRLSTSSAYSFLPQWIVFSLPNGLWVYAITAFMAVIWRDAGPSRLKTAWLSAGLLFGIGSEVGQAASLIPGTFDLIDILVCIVASCVAVFTQQLLTIAAKPLNPNMESTQDEQTIQA